MLDRLENVSTEYWSMSVSYFTSLCPLAVFNEYSIEFVDM